MEDLIISIIGTFSIIDSYYVTYIYILDIIIFHYFVFIIFIIMRI